MPRGPINAQYAPGIGRPVRADWAATVENVLTHNLPPKARLRMRKTPGINYVSGQEILNREILPYHGSYDEMATAVSELSADTLAVLTKSKKVDNEIARQPYADLPFRIETKRRAQDYFALFATVLDPKSDFYECGHQFAGERIAFRRELGVPLDPSEQGPARTRNVPFAMISGISAVALGSTLDSLMKVVPVHMPIGEIDVIRPENV